MAHKKQASNRRIGGTYSVHHASRLIACRRYPASYRFKSVLMFKSMSNRIRTKAWTSRGPEGSQ